MSVILMEFYTTIFEEDFDEGQGNYTGCGHPITKLARKFDTLPEALKWFGHTYGYPTDESNWECPNDDGVYRTGRLVADHSNEQNGGWFEPTVEEQAEWATGTLKLFSEEVTLKLEHV